ncbi:MAG: DJ-1/PfpI family protein [Gemmatimonadetes bacterium]|nr:DJ-1/PfpI family protein [Gemmatimonadota bacterium]
MRRTPVGIVVFPDVEVLDFAGPFEVFSVTRLNEETRYSDSSPFDVFLVAETADPVVATGGLRVLPAHSLETCPPLDVLVVPGGLGTRVQVGNPRLIGWIRERAERARTVASVCTGSFLLAHAGLLEGLRATTHWRSLDRMEQAYPGVQVERGLHVVDEGSVLTSAGISAGIDMALCVVARHHGESVARATARHMEYPYPESNERRIQLPG